MHQIQQKLLALSKTKNLEKMTLREMGAAIGVAHPQQVKFHLDQLVKKNLIFISKDRKTIRPVEGGKVKASDLELINVPILGSASCGPATFFADANLQGYLKVSPSVIGRKNTSNLYALKAEGDSMNKARIGKDRKSLDTGDYALIENKELDTNESEYVVSIMEGMANIKRLIKDPANHRILLLSESTRDIPPIVIHENDDFSVSGVVMDVVKKPQI